jgi:hypothetical protein
MEPETERIDATTNRKDQQPVIRNRNVMTQQPTEKINERTEHPTVYRQPTVMETNRNEKTATSQKIKNRKRNVFFRGNNQPKRSTNRPNNQPCIDNQPRWKRTEMK